MTTQRRRRRWRQNRRFIELRFHYQLIDARVSGAVVDDDAVGARMRADE
jgi:hypothetical protein